MTIDVSLGDLNHGLLGHNQLTTIDQSELSAQLGLSLGGGAILPRTRSPDQLPSDTGSPSDSLQDDDVDDFRQVGVVCFCYCCWQCPLNVLCDVSAVSPLCFPPIRLRRACWWIRPSLSPWSLSRPLGRIRLWLRRPPLL